MNQETVDATGLTSRTAQEVAGKYLTFRLGAEEFGLEILNVQEIIGLMHIRPMPQTPPYIRGVINLRGRVIPVVELRRKFQMPSVEDTERTCIIVVQATANDRNMTMGLLVDEVSEVFDIRADKIEPPPDFGSGVATHFILGMGKISDRVVVLLDINRVLSASEMSTVIQATPAPSALGAEQ